MSLRGLFSSVQTLLSLCFFSLICAKYCISYPNLLSFSSAAQHSAWCCFCWNKWQNVHWEQNWSLYCIVVGLRDQQMPLPVTWKTPEDLSAFGLVNYILCMQITGICSKHYFGKYRWLDICAKIYFQVLQSGNNTATQLHYISKIRICIISCIASKQKWDSNIQALRAWY